MEMLDKSINELRRVAHNMMPEALIRFGLDTALRIFATVSIRVARCASPISPTTSTKRLSRA